MVIVLGLSVIWMPASKSPGMDPGHPQLHSVQSQGCPGPEWPISRDMLAAMRCERRCVVNTEMAMRCDAMQKSWRCAFSQRKSSAMCSHDAKTLAMRCRDAGHSVQVHCAVGGGPQRTQGALGGPAGFGGLPGRSPFQHCGDMDHGVSIAIWALRFQIPSELRFGALSRQR